MSKMLVFRIKQNDENINNYYKFIQFKEIKMLGKKEKQVETKSEKSSSPITRVEGKEFSPLVLRRYSTPELMFVALITDQNLNNLDEVVRGFQDQNKIPNNIQGVRDYAGALTDYLYQTYGHSVEGAAVILQADKMTVSSLKGDFMNHGQCRLELYSLLNFATQV